MRRHIRKSSANVFADLGVKDPEEALVKARLAHVIAVAIKVRGLTQVEAAELLGIDQPKISRLVPHAKITTPSPWGEGQGEGISCRSGSNPR